ncbi:MAG: 16S rRNA (adenine(1518)-N(6)/adenine(1519)-N(6))-dimethyltransferase RsmA [Proteobacteria bacterium]|nr:16S rRNA (adenine(1518)-N(6)/adenine(1519)-N(6))-dimethyltransferase RsmA [Pseudomonadota bacterium]MDA0929276.1 16S rRNA (adenine(1518)-N(6)/adenine(1519)-N(6))-dimethyltransferase RsmA [Pseudomonadota bacterium]
MKPAIPMTNGRPHQARKRFGQNFLHDQGVIQRIIDAIHPVNEDHLLEIGPGQGALTRPLADSGARLDCVELDRDLADFLQKQFSGRDNVTIIQQDVLKFDLASLVDGEEPVLRVIGNLPYNISTPVMFHLLKRHSLIRDMVFMLQLEVVQRLAAKPGDKNYGRLGLMTQYYCDVQHLFNVPSAAFTPRPKVSSAIVRLVPHQQFPVAARDVGCLQVVVRTAFNQRRKTLKNSLKAIISEERLMSLPLEMGQRPENLSLEDYVLISDALSDELADSGTSG